MPNINAWRTAGETASFPFREGATLTSDNSGSLPEGLLVDAQIFVPQHLPGIPYLGLVGLVGSRISGSIMAEDVVLSTFSIDAATINSAVVSLTSPDGMAAGVLVFGAQASRVFRSLRIGQNAFTEDESGFESSCVFRYPTGALNQIVVDEVPISGKIALIEGKGIELVVSGNEVRIDAIGSSEKIEECCESSGTAIVSINNATHDPSGNLSFNLAQFSEPVTPNDLRQVLRITPTANGLNFSLAI